MPLLSDRSEHVRIMLQAEPCGYSSTDLLEHYMDTADERVTMPMDETLLDRFCVDALFIRALTNEAEEQAWEQLYSSTER